MFQLIAADIFNFALAVSALVAVFNGMIHGYTGFGGALIIIPVLTFFFGPIEAIAIVGLVTMFGAVLLARKTVHHVKWREIVPICIGIAAFTPLGAWYLYHIDADFVRRLMGGFILVFAFVLLSGWNYRGKRGLFSSSFVGSIAGSVNGLTGVGGPPLGLYFLSSPYSVEVQRANIVFCIAVLTVSMVIASAVGGAYAIDVIARALLLVPIYMSGVWLGSYFFKLAPKDYFRKVALVILIITGLCTLIF
ncbi:MAG: hypothetical protein CMM53_13445 [Rhodospirillaceae bacterium]|nr:hypothetical protein [Rhodospirillaceae bacterium]|tara:strand:+ start:1313 stop:2059 length:747 start_codon:yes stop_codon:yes gene_type:complete